MTRFKASFGRTFGRSFGRISAVFRQKLVVILVIMSLELI
jgi:hypothetical protein